MKVILLFTFFPLLLLFSCNEEEKKREASNHLETSIVTLEEKIEGIKDVFFNIPLPSETGQILLLTGTDYEFKITNNPMAIDKYHTLEKQAFNLGVYGADLNYASICNEITETMFFLRSVQNLGRSLGVEQAFNETMINRIEDNIEDVDSMQIIIDEVFYAINDRLNSENREDVSAQIIAGGWIEGLYLASVLSTRHPENLKIRAKINQQRATLTSIIQLLEKYPEKGFAQEILDHLYHLAIIFVDDESIKSSVFGDAALQDLLVEITTLREEIIH